MWLIGGLPQRFMKEWMSLCYINASNLKALLDWQQVWSFTDAPSSTLLRLPLSFHKWVRVIAHHYCQQVEGDTQACSLRPESTNSGLSNSLQKAAPAVLPAPAVPQPQMLPPLWTIMLLPLCRALGLTPWQGHFRPAANPKWPWCKQLHICTGSETARLLQSSVCECSAENLPGSHRVTALFLHPNKEVCHKAPPVSGWLGIAGSCSVSAFLQARLGRSSPRDSLLSLRSEEWGWAYSRIRTRISGSQRVSERGRRGPISLPENPASGECILPAYSALLGALFLHPGLCF